LSVWVFDISGWFVVGTVLEGTAAGYNRFRISLRRTPSAVEPIDVSPEELLGIGEAPKIGDLPAGSKVIRTDPNGNCVVFENADGVMNIQFKAASATRLSKGPLGPD